MMDIGFLGLIVVLLILGILVAIVVAIVVAVVLIWRSRTMAAPRTALEILEMRYASGEIDVETYKEMRARLEDSV